MSTDQEFEEADRQFEETDTAVVREVATFIIAIDRMMVRWDAVTPQYILECVLLLLCEELTKRMGPSSSEATLKLSNAMLDYRDSRFEERD